MEVRITEGQARGPALPQTLRQEPTVALGGSSKSVYPCQPTACTSNAGAQPPLPASSAASLPAFLAAHALPAAHAAPAAHLSALAASG